MRLFVEPEALAYLRTHSVREDEVLAHVQASVTRQRLPSITPEAGALLHVVVRLLQAKRILEVGTCLGYSGIWMARALDSDGRLDTIERDPQRAHEARGWFEHAGVQDRVKVHEVEAIQYLEQAAPGAYDLVFLDADKEGLPSYLPLAVRALRPGGALAVDNVFWQGTAFDPEDQSPGAAQVRAFVDAARAHKELNVAILPLGDGLLLAHRS